MFLFEKMSLKVLIAAILVLAGLVALNEITRRSRKMSLAIYIIFPIVFSIFVWPKTKASDPSLQYWFPWVKMYSSLAGVIGFMLIRYREGVEKSKFAKIFPPLILSINILEAVYRDFEIFFLYNGVETIVNDTWMAGGPWNVINGIAGIINIITLTGFVGIYVSKQKSRDLMWPDQLWFWIVAYDLWNFAYVYNCLADRSIYCGLILVLAGTVPYFMFKKGPWLQHRAQTLALYTMFTMTFPGFANGSQFALKSSQSTTALLVVSIAALVWNLGVLIYEIKIIKETKRNPLKEELYVDTKAYKEVMAEDQ